MKEKDQSDQKNTSKNIIEEALIGRKVSICLSLVEDNIQLKNSDKIKEDQKINGNIKYQKK